MIFTDGLCSLRLRKRCEWQGAIYESVTAVPPIPLLSGAGLGAQALQRGGD